MANILQVTKPSVDMDNRLLDNRDPKGQIHNQNIHNQVDPSRVVRADGQEEGGSGKTAQDGNYSVIDYESNYGSFVQRLKDAGTLPELLKQLLFEGGAEILFGSQESVAGLMEQLFASMSVDSPEELLAFLKNQQAAQAKFSGEFFDGLRNILFQDAPQGLKDTALAFLKTYNDYSSGRHLLLQMRSLTEDISRLMLKNFRGEFELLANEMDWEAANGDTAANTVTLNTKLIPFLSQYISRTHDYGAVRDAVMFFVLHAVKYENGGQDGLEKLFERLMGGRDVERFFKNISPDLAAVREENGGQDGLARLFEKFIKGGDLERPSKNVSPDLEQALGDIRRTGGGREFADAFSVMLKKGTEGQAGLENIQQFYNILNGMLLNESVYLPFLHILLPVRYRGKEMMSEIWADPDAKKEPGEAGRKIKMFFKFDIRELGAFNMVMSLRDRKMDMQLYIPPVLADKTQSIQENVSGILKKNGMEISHLLVKEKAGEIRLEDVFPEIKEKERTINVRI